MAAEGVASQQQGVRRQDEAADADAEMARTRTIGEPERLDRVANQNDDEHQPEVQKIPVHVPEDEREESLPQVAVARFSNRAGQRIGPERFVIGAAIVITGEAESARRPQNQQRCRKRERARPPPGFRAEPRVRAVAKQQRRIERRQVRAIFEMVALKGSPCRVDDERGECEKNEERLKPPRVATSCFSKLSLGQGPHGLRHRESSEYGPVSVKPYRRWNGIASAAGLLLATCLRMSEEEATTRELSNEEKRANVIRLAFAGSREKFDRFVEVVRQAIPPGTGVVLRGSAVTGERWKDGAPFDSDGPGTSDLDLTLVGGDEVIGLYKITGFWVPGIHSRPLSDEDPDIAPDLVPLRQRLMAMVNRPVNIQASRDVVIYFRGELIGQPYLVLIDKPQAD